MNKFQLLTELPAGWIIVCVGLGILYAYFLYRNDSLLDSVHPWLRKFLFGLRAVLIFFLALLLLSPLIRTFSREKEKPVIVVAQDNSQSIVLNKDSAFYRTAYKEKLNSLIGSLKDQYDVQTISFGDRIGDQIDFSFNEKQTNLSDMIDQLDTRFGNRNVGAVIVASDGLYNQGSSPLYASSALKVPFYTIALGDTTVQKDVFIAKVNYNKTVYLGNNFPVEVTVNARQCIGAKTTMTVLQDSSVVFTKELTPVNNRFSQVVPLVLEAKKKGLVHYKIRLSPVSGEMTTENNERDIYIEVAESKQKILILADAPHPDIGAIKTALETNENYEIELQMAERFSGSLKEYSLVIFHNLPSADYPIADVFTRVKAEKTSMLIIAGTQIRAVAFNQLNLGLEISQSLDKSNIVAAKLNPDFSLYTISDDLRKMVGQFPPLQLLYGRYRSTGNNTILFTQQIGNVPTDQPLQIFNQGTDNKIGIVCGEGIWRWRQTDFEMNDNFNAFNEWILKTVQNLSIKEEKTHFRMVTKNSFAENEQVSFESEVYNDNYELINTPDVNLTITGPNNKTYPFTFSKTDRAYTLSAGYFPAGDYSYKANVKVGDKPYLNSGKFTITRLQAEMSETVADHQLMYTLAAGNGGIMVYPNQMNDLVKRLEERKDIKTITYSHYKLRDLVDMKAVFFLLLAILSLEWFLRKRAGAY